MDADLTKIKLDTENLSKLKTFDYTPILDIVRQRKVWEQTFVRKSKNLF